MAAAGLGTTEQDTTGRLKTEAQAIEAIQLLLDRGFDINAQANDGPNGPARRRDAGLRRRHPVPRREGAKLDIPDKDGFTPLDVALGKAGGFGFSGNEGVLREATAALLTELMAAQPPGAAAAAAR